ncbi:MAG: small basic family protein [Actinobacteria bacterium]|nr:small basic family protein [Actinomycetota bacterium]
MSILAGVTAGVLLGVFVTLEIPAVIARYVSIALLASFDTLIGGLKSYLKKEFDEWIFVSGFLANSLLAAFISYLGDRLGIELYLAVLLVFGMRIFQNLAELRHALILKLRRVKKNK